MSFAALIQHMIGSLLRGRREDPRYRTPDGSWLRRPWRGGTQPAHRSGTV